MAAVPRKLTCGCSALVVHSFSSQQDGFASGMETPQIMQVKDAEWNEAWIAEAVRKLTRTAGMSRERRIQRSYRRGDVLQSLPTS